MSVKHTTWVWEHSKAEGGTLLVALALADAVNSLDDADECWPKQSLLAKRVRLTERSVGRAIKELVDLGEIEKQRTINGNRYRFIAMGAQRAGTGTAAADPRLHYDDAGGVRADQTKVPVGEGADVARDQTSLSTTSTTLASDLRVEPEVEPEVNQNTTGAGQTSLIAAPEAELFARWQRVFDRFDATLTPARRRVALRAIKEEPNLDALEQAMRGFKEYRMSKPGGMELGDIFATYRDTGDLRSRIEWLRAKASTGTNGPTTVQQLVARLPSEVHAMVHGWIGDVEAWMRNPDHPGLKATATSRLNDLKSKARMEPTIEDGRITGWKETNA